MRSLIVAYLCVCVHFNIVSLQSPSNLACVDESLKAVQRAIQNGNNITGDWNELQKLVLNDINLNAVNQNGNTTLILADIDDVPRVYGRTDDGEQGEGGSDFHFINEPLICSDINGPKATVAVRAGIQTVHEIWEQYLQKGRTGKSDKHLHDFELHINQIKYRLDNAAAHYDGKTKAVSNWCTDSNPKLLTYKSQKAGGKESPPKDTLVNSFWDGQLHAYELQRLLLTSSGFAQEANNLLVAMKYRINDLRYDAATQTQQINKIKSVRTALKQLLCVEIDVDNQCNALRAAFGKAGVFMWIDDDLGEQTLADQAIDNLVAKCSEFNGKTY